MWRDAAEYGLVNWQMHHNLQKVIQVCSVIWWEENKDEILAWMESIDARMNPSFKREERPPIFLYNESEITYFNLKWPQEQNTRYTR